MKKLLSLFLILILTSCSKYKKEAALENCADYYFLDSHERYNSIITNYKEDLDYKLIENRIIYYEKEKKIKEIQLKYLSKRFKKEHPAPLEDPNKFKYPVLSVTMIKDDTDIFYDMDLYDKQMDLYNKQRDEHNKEKKKNTEKHHKEIREWMKKERDYLSNINKEISTLESQIKKTESELPAIRYTLIDKAFKKLQLKGKSKIDIYIDIYAGCEKLYNKTPSAFLLEWQK